MKWSMADYPYITCPICGAKRPMERFGLETDGRYNPDTEPAYRIELSVKHTGGGYRGIQWTHSPLPRQVILGLRQRVDSALDGIDAALSDGHRLRCLACGRLCEPEDMAIDDGGFDPDQAQMYTLVLLEPSTDDNGGNCWKPVADWSPVGGRRSVVIAILERLEWVAKQLRQALQDGNDRLVPRLSDPAERGGICLEGPDFVALTSNRRSRSARPRSCAIA
jgi:hypothetical protein